MKVFISVGMTGRRAEEVAIDICRASLKIFNRYGHNDTDVIHNLGCRCPEEELGTRLYYLGEAIKKLGNCDICYFTKGWQNYRGCRAEMEICKIYGIKIIEEA